MSFCPILGVEISQPVFRGRENRVHLFVGGMGKWTYQIAGRMGETVTEMVVNTL